MNFCDRAIVLRRRPLQENGRIVTLYTRGHGKLEVNFKGVARAAGKLKALSEPLTAGDYRLHLRPGSNFPVCTGGTSLRAFPGIRAGAERLFMASHFCELVMAMTPYADPNPEKYDLLLSALERLDSRGFTPWTRRAFSLRLAELVGVGFAETSVGLDPDLWATLHSGSWDGVDAAAADDDLLRRVDATLEKCFAGNLGLTFKTAAFV
ncbi:MAG: DNA repair protein RecO [Elusimicrobiales bacterium]|jgi:DNA repair protein RecO (recombination protein O)|nr:DNA repair protein RecO [Elusimicrobiales bacterium]